MLIRYEICYILGIFILEYFLWISGVRLIDLGVVQENETINEWKVRINNWIAKSTE